jgi:hypothetical protein
VSNPNGVAIADRNDPGAEISCGTGGCLPGQYR